MTLNFSKIVLYVFLLAVVILTFLTLPNYPGQSYIFVIFTVLLNSYLLAGFRKNRIYFDTFLGTLLWLGFWMKLTVHLSFMNGEFTEAIGNFDHSGHAYDVALTAINVGIAGLLIASFCREKFIFSYPRMITKNSYTNLFNIYVKYRKTYLSVFLFTVLIVAAVNVYLGIYQRGTVPLTILPFGMNGIFAWVLFFGFASCSAIFLNFELKINKSPYVVALIVLLESFISNVSMYSRGMILNCAGLFVGTYDEIGKPSALSNFKFKTFATAAFMLLFLGSVFSVNYVRTHKFEKKELSELSVGAQVEMVSRGSGVLFIDRWVGMEGMMAISSYPYLGWDLFKTALAEKYYPYGTTFYDHTFITSPYMDFEPTKMHYVSLPGMLAFFYYPGSISFLFSVMLILGIVGSLFELFIYKFGGSNLILTSLLSQVIAYRYAHFGYVPKQSYLLFGSIIANTLIFYFLEKTLEARRAKKFN